MFSTILHLIKIIKGLLFRSRLLHNNNNDKNQTNKQTKPDSNQRRSTSGVFFRSFICLHFHKLIQITDFTVVKLKAAFSHGIKSCLLMRI